MSAKMLLKQQTTKRLNRYLARSSENEDDCGVQPIVHSSGKFLKIDRDATRQEVNDK